MGGPGGNQPEAGPAGAVACVICGGPLDPALLPATTHPSCLFTELGEDPAAQQLKNELIEIIKFADKRNPRAQQTALGPSEIGTPCDRRLGYRIANIPAVNTDVDPWAAVIGTAMHGWLEEAVRIWCSEHWDCPWVTETPVVLGDFVKGRSDLFNTSTCTVVDYKGAGPDVMRKVRKDGPPPGYVIQVQLYGLGYQNLGHTVKKVALAFLPRAGWLKDAYVWVDDFRPDVATKAMERIFELSSNLVHMDILNSPHRWEQVPAFSSNECGFCPWYNPGRDLERGADATGCPGH